MLDESCVILTIAELPDAYLLAVRPGAFQSIGEIRTSPANDFLTATPEIISKFAITAR